MEFFRQEYWSGLPLAALGGLPDPGIKPTSLVSLALAGRLFTTEPRGKPQRLPYLYQKGKSFMSYSWIEKQGVDVLSLPSSIPSFEDLSFSRIYSQPNFYPCHSSLFL